MLRVRLFGHLHIEGDSAAVRAALRPRAQRLLAYLLLSRGGPRPREHIAFTLWPNSPERESLGALRRALNDVRAGLPPVSGTEWIVVHQVGLRWNLEAPYWLDVSEFERLVHAATPAAWHQAAELYAADLLVDWDEEWVRSERERLRQLQHETLHQLILHHRALGEFPSALRYARQVVSVDPLSEAAARDLIVLWYESGDRAASLAEYSRFRSLLQNELGVEPMAETQAVVAAITQGHPLPQPQSHPAALPQESPGTVGPARLIGREAEWAHLINLWARATGGHGRLAIVSGGAGIGKSHLVLSLADEARRQGGLTLIGHSYEFEHALPYQAIVEMLRSGASLLRYASLSAAHRSTLARLVPDALGVAGPPPPEGETLSSDLRPQLFEALFQAFLAIARSQPLFLLFEDVHWAAESTLDWLTYIAPRLSTLPMLVAITYRTDEVGAEHALARLEKRLARESAVSLLRLNPLSREAHRDLVAHLSGLPRALADPIADRLFEETAGNPFFLKEIVRELIERGQITIAQDQWTGAFVASGPHVRVPLPESIVDTIGARVERLTEMSRMLLTTSAVAGRVFHFQTVQHAGGWGDEQTLKAVEDLLARGFLCEGEAQGELAFTHHLVREAIYTRLVAPRRAFWHRRLAEAAHALRPDDLTVLAYHFLAAGDHAKAVGYFRQAARRAVALQAYEDGLSALEAASLAIDHLRRDRGTDPPAVRQEIEVLLERAALIPLLGRPLEEHRRVVQAAADLLARYPDGALQATLYLRQSDLLAESAQYARAIDAALAAHQQHQAMGNHSGAAQALLRAGRYKLTISENKQSLPFLEQALTLFRLAGDAANESWCLTLLGWVRLNLGEVQSALAHLARALELSEQHADRLGVARACYTLAAAWGFYYEAERVRPLAERSLRLYQEIGLSSAGARPKLWLGAAYYLQGDIPQAEALYAEAMEGARALEDSWLEGWALQNLGRSALARGDLAQAEHHLERARQLRQVSGEAANQVSDLLWLGRLRLAQGRAVEALAYTNEAITRLEALWGEFYVWEMPDVFLGHAEALAANGHETAAGPYIQRAYDTLMQFAAQIEDPQVKERFLAYPGNVRVVGAWERGRVTLLPSGLRRN